MEFHPSGCVTFPILGTKAKQEDKLAFDPDRSKRRKIYAEVVDTFSDYCVFVGGSSSFDMAPKPFNKYYALDLYCREHGFAHDEVIFVGDDYGLGGNDESVYRSDFRFVTIDDYTRLSEVLAPWIETDVPDIAELLGMSLSAISHQLRVLKQAKLVKYRRDGKTVFYSLADDHVRAILGQGMEHVEE